MESADAAAELMALAHEAVECFGDVAGIRMALVTGSVARGNADDRSDLDLVICVDELDPSTLSDERLAAVGANRLFGVARDEGFFEKYRRRVRHVDIEYLPRSRLESAATAIGGGTADGEIVKIAAGIADAVAIRGAAELSGWQQRLAYSNALARAEVARRGVRLVSLTSLHQLTLERGDVVSYARRASGVVLDAIALLGAANRVFIPVDDPKWIPWQIGRLRAVPAAAYDRAARALSTPTPDALRDADAMLEEVLDIVDARVEGADTRIARYALTLHPRGGD